LRKAEGGVAEVFEAAIDGLCRSVAGVGSVEAGQDVGRASGQCPPERDDLAKGGTSWLVEVISLA
jgi:hypothetical protein